MISDDNIEEFENELEKKKKLPEEVKHKIKRRIIENILLLIGIFIYTVVLIVAFKKINFNNYLIDLRVMSFALCVLSIVTFEVAYKKENMVIGTWGIEIIILAIITLFCTYISILKESEFIMFLLIIPLSYLIYYFIKNFLIYKKIKKEYINSLSDISEIVKKEKPVKKKETKRKRI